MQRHDMVHAGWGDPARRKGLPHHAIGWLEDRLGSGAPSAPAPVADVKPAPSALTDDARKAIDATGAAVLDDDATRIVHAAGRSYLDLIALRSGSFDVPDAVVRPGAEQVVAVLAACAAHDVAVVPFGGGTSVVGGVTPIRGTHSAVIALDLRLLDDLVSLSETDRTATLQAGLTGPQAEALLNARGHTLGHFPQSFEHATIGGFAATRSAGQASTGYGRFDANVLGLTLATPRGELKLGKGAATAAGPGLLQLVVGSEGQLGVITEVTMRVKPVPETRKYDAYLVRSWEDGIAQLRRLEQSGITPDVARLSDFDETEVNLRLSAPGLVQRLAKGRCLLILGWEGTHGAVAARRGAAHVKGLPLPGAGAKWEHGRYDGPYLRDDLMDAGYLVETLETSNSWSGLTSTWTAVRDAISDVLPNSIVMCHVSHLYPQGASLYFTVIAPKADEPVSQWQQAKTVASNALVATGATITHHHAVGTDHRPWMNDEIGELGAEVLRAAKQVLDPQGILNPGKTIP